MTPLHRLRVQTYARIQREMTRAWEAQTGAKRRPVDIDVALRDAEFRDARAIGEMHVETWKTTYRGMMSDRVIRNLHVGRFEMRWEELIARQVTDFTLIANDSAEGIVGFARGGPTEREEDRRFGPHELYALNVEPRFQNRGVGKGLFIRTLERFHDAGAESLFCWVLDDNADSRFFFKALGGRAVGAGHDKMGAELLPKTAYLWHDLEGALVALTEDDEDWVDGPYEREYAAGEYVRLPGLSEALADAR